MIRFDIFTQWSLDHDALKGGLWTKNAEKSRNKQITLNCECLFSRVAV